MEFFGSHRHAEHLPGKDVNGRYMVICRDCGACAHHYDKDQAARNLRNWNCSADCTNCKSLMYSHDRSPAVPVGGSCNDKLHRCPNDGNRWWQTNTHFHLWQAVTDNKEWEILQQETRSINHEDSDFGVIGLGF